MEPNFSYDSRVPEDKLQQGENFYPILESAINRGVGSWFHVRTYGIVSNSAPDLYAATYATSTLAFCKGDQGGDHRLVTVDADFSLDDLDLILEDGGRPISKKMVCESIDDIQDAVWRYGTYEILSAVRESRHATKMPKHQFPSEKIVDLATQANKLYKRAGTITRVFRSAVSRPSFNVLVVPDTKGVLEGIGRVNPRLLREANDNTLQLNWKPVLHRAQLVKKLDRETVRNGRVVGRLYDAQTGEMLDGHLKGQFALGEGMPSEIDFIVPAEMVKHELRAKANCEWAIAGVEPQGPKGLAGDRQTVNNHPFIKSIPEVRKGLKDEAAKVMRDLTAGTIVNVDASVDEELETQFSWNGANYARMLRYNSTALATYGVSYLDSPWLTERLGLQWPMSLRWSVASRGDQDEPQDSQGLTSWDRTLHYKVECGRRMQIISQSAHNMVFDLVGAGEHIEVERGTLRQGTSLQVLVVHDDDYIDALIKSHGGSDQDDFYQIMQRLINGERKYLVFRNPNARGEFTVWDFVEGDEVWEHERFNGDIITFPPITKKRWPTQILDALASGETTYLQLPSEVDPTKTHQDDQDAVMAEQLAIFNQLVAERIPADKMLLQRLSDPTTSRDEPRSTKLTKRIPATEKSIFTSTKKVMEKEIRIFERDLKAFTQTLPIPDYVRDLGQNSLNNAAKDALRFARGAMHNADVQFAKEGPEVRRQQRLRAENGVLLEFLDRHPTDAWLAQAVMALWWTCRTVKTKGGYTTDRPMFGTAVFMENLDETHSRWRLLEALQFYGLTTEPHNLGIHIDFKTGEWEEYDASRWAEYVGPQVEWVGNKHFNVTCSVCAKQYHVDHDQLVKFHANNGVCRLHRA